jgi:hypothetical protein
LFYDEAEQRRRDGEVVRGPLRRVQLLADSLKGARVFVVAVNITQQATQLVKGCRLDSSPVFLDAAPRPGSELIDIPTCLGHPDYRHVEVAPFDHRLQRRKDFLVGQIARGTEEDQRI